MTAEVEHVFEKRLAALEATAARQEAELRAVLGRIRGVLADVEGGNLGSQRPRPRLSLVEEASDDG
jgi:hypothetical protein